MSDRDQAQSFGPAAERYDARRPTYPPEALRWALGEAPLHVVDLGAGTGILSRVLVRLGHRVTPVEPDPAMRDRLDAATPGVRALAGTAESIPLPDASVDAVTAGQSYHWFDRERAHPEIARVLRPAGVFTPIWNIRDESEPWVARLTSISNRLEGHNRDHDGWLTGELGPLFEPPEREVFRHVLPMDADRLVELMATRSYYLTAPAEAQERYRGEVRELAATLTPAFDLPYLTAVYRVRRASG